MSIPVEIKDSRSGTRARVTPENALLVTSTDRSGFQTGPEILTRYKLLRTFLENTSNSIEMNVDGSITPVEFFLGAQEDRVLYVERIRIVLKGTYFEADTQDFRRFGEATAGNTPLTNGFDLVAYQGGVETNLFSDTVTIMGDFFNDAETFTNLKNSVGAQEDFLSFDFLLDRPVTLVPGTTDKISMVVQDDLTPVDEFRVLIRGYQEVRG